MVAIVVISGGIELTAHEMGISYKFLVFFLMLFLLSVVSRAQEDIKPVDGQALARPAITQ